MMRIATVALLTVLCLGSLGTAQPDSYALPGEGVFPEGIALSADGATFFVGSTATGTIYRGDVESGEVEVLAEGAAPSAIGMDVDEHGRLWVAGGMTGNVFVYDTETGELLREYATPETEATFLNDVVVADGGAFVTDSARPELFRIGAGEELGELESFVSFADTVFPYDAQFNANGIVVSPDGSALVIVHSGNGGLYRVDLASRDVSEVASTTDPVTAGDGMVLDGNTLYVVRNALGQVDRLTLSDAGDAVEPAGDPITGERFAFPTTAAFVDGDLLVVNSQFDRQGEGVEPRLPFTVARVGVD